MSAGKRATGIPTVRGGRIPDVSRFPGSEVRGAEVGADDGTDAQTLSDAVAAAIVAGEFDDILGIRPDDLGLGESARPRRTSGLTA